MRFSKISGYIGGISGNQTLRVRVLRAGGWTLLLHLLSNIMRLGSSLVMTRLLAPEMFGVMAIALVVQVIISLLTDIGLRQAIIHSPRGNESEFLNTAWTLQALRGVLIWAVCFGVAACLYLAKQSTWLPEASVYSTEILPFVLAVASFEAVIAGLQSTKMVTASRHLDLKRASMVEVLAQLSGVFSMIVLAWWTRSIWSFVAGGLISAVTSSLLGHLWLAGPTNRFGWSRNAVAEIVGYGRWIFLSSIAYVVASRIDRLLIGIWASAATLGFYSIAVIIIGVIDTLGQRVFASVAMPALSEAARHDQKRFRQAYFRMRLPIDLAFVGTAGFFFGSGAFLVDLLYDARYALAGEMLKLLSFGLLFVRYGLTQSAYLALGQPRYQTIINGIKLTSILVLVPTMYHLYGLSGAVVAVAIHPVAMLPWIYRFSKRHGLLSLRFEASVLLAWPIGYAISFLARLL